MKITEKQIRQIIREEIYTESDQMSLPLYDPPAEKDERFLNKGGKINRARPRFVKEKGTPGPVWTKKYPSRSEKNELFINVYSNGFLEIGFVRKGLGAGYKNTIITGNIAPLIQKGIWDESDYIFSDLGKKTRDFHQTTLDKAQKIIEDNIDQISQAVYGDTYDFPNPERPWEVPQFKENKSAKLKESQIRQIIREELENMIDVETAENPETGERYLYRIKCPYCETWSDPNNTYTDIDNAEVPGDYGIYCNTCKEYRQFSMRG